MKKILALILIASSLFMLFGCDNKYKPVESTEEEARVMFTLTCGDSTYEVRYELYRALFLANKGIVDGGDATVWEGDNSAEYVERINKIIAAKASDIFAAIHHAKEIGYDAYSKDADAEIQEYVKGAVEGDDEQIGHGSYDAYLESLKNNFLNYSVATLLMRYSFAMTAINKYYGGEVHEVFGNTMGEYQYTADDVREYYVSDECARVMEVYVPTGIRSKVWFSDFCAKLMLEDSELDMAVKIISGTSATEADLIVGGDVSGLVIGKNSLNDIYYSDYRDLVFSTAPGMMSEILELSGTESDGYYAIYGLEKTDEHFVRCYEQVRLSFIDNLIGSRLAPITHTMIDSLSFTDEYSEIIHKDVSMD